ncbi:hydroxyacyl-thioester dehydratase type 2, mitochondrial-like [Lytechinus pictus]|uniref:hydroxyacyl-thioester dehydratase type 2, mitochondrial-like n=1 Tax=Lytechinus pictus TaxID=7653 RepID=UPI0030B9E410
MSHLLHPFKSIQRCSIMFSRMYASGSSVLLWFQKGDKAALSRTFSGEEVRLFAELSGDTNPLHTDEEYAAKTRFGRTVVHGVLLNGLASAVMGTKLPGPGTIVISHSTEFPKPLFIGEEVIAEVEITDVRSLLVNCAITCRVPERDEIVMTGTATLLAPKSARRKKLNPNSEET